MILMHPDEPILQPNDLEERLKTTRNRVEIALLLIELGRKDLVFTVIEDIYFGTQCMLDIHCVKEK